MSGRQSCEVLEWDTEFWGFPVARVLGSAIEPQAMKAAVRWCDDREVRCTYLLVDAADMKSLAVAQDHGFSFVDTRIDLRRDARAEGAREPIAAGVRPARAEDLPELERIARDSIASTRFFADPHFDPERSRELYAAWVRRRMSGADNLVMVAEPEGATVGFLAGHADAGGEVRHELVAVDPRHRGAGIARALTAAFSEHLAGGEASFETTATQAGNLAGLRMWQSVGFNIVEIHHWLHRWQP